MSDMINRQDAIDAINRLSDQVYETIERGATFPSMDWFSGMAKAVDILKSMPAENNEAKE